MQSVLNVLYLKAYFRIRKKRFKKSEFVITRTAWAVFKYCGTKTVPLRMKKKNMKRLI